MAEQQQLQPGQTEEPAETGFFDRLFSGDKPLWIIVISLAIISLLVVYSSTASMAYKNAGGNTAHYFFNQLKFIAIGFVIMCSSTGSTTSAMCALPWCCSSWHSASCCLRS